MSNNGRHSIKNFLLKDKETFKQAINISITSYLDIIHIIHIIHIILFIILENNKGFAMAQEVSRLSLTAKERIRSQDNLCRICVTQSVTATDSHFSRHPPVFPVCHSTHLTDIAAYSTDTNRQRGRTQSVWFSCLYIVSLGETSALQLFFQNI